MKQIIKTIGILIAIVFGVCIIGSVSKVNAAVTSQLNTKQGISIDIARHPLAKADIEQLMQAAAGQNMDYVQLHLSDNENLSFQSDYLGNTASATVLSKQDLTDLVSYANSLNIQLIPDVDVPSHMGAILTLLKQSHPDVYNEIRLDDETIDYTTTAAEDFVKTLYAEINPIFINQPNRDFMMGADEVPGGDAAHVTLIDFLNSLNAYQNAVGYTTEIWNDQILKSELNRLDKNIVINYWSQGANNNDQTILQERLEKNISVSDILNSDHQIINSNSYAMYYQMSYIGIPQDDDYFINFLNNIWKPNVFNEIDSNLTN